MTTQRRCARSWRRGGLAWVCAAALVAAMCAPHAAGDGTGNPSTASSTPQDSLELTIAKDSSEALISIMRGIVAFYDVDFSNDQLKPLLEDIVGRAQKTRKILQQIPFRIEEQYKAMITQAADGFVGLAKIVLNHWDEAMAPQLAATTLTTPSDIKGDKWQAIDYAQQNFYDALDVADRFLKSQKESQLTKMAASSLKNIRSIVSYLSFLDSYEMPVWDYDQDKERDISAKELFKQVWLVLSGKDSFLVPPEVHAANPSSGSNDQPSPSDPSTPSNNAPGASPNSSPAKKQGGETSQNSNAAGDNNKVDEDDSSQINLQKPTKAKPKMSSFSRFLIFASIITFILFICLLIFFYWRRRNKETRRPIPHSELDAELLAEDLQILHE